MSDSIKDWLRISYGMFLHITVGFALLLVGFFVYMAALFLAGK
jgi:hypothetical protein